MSQSLETLDRPRRALGFAAITLAATLWAIAAVAASQLFAAGVSPLELAMIRAVIAAVGLAGINYWKPSAAGWKDWRILALGLSLALVTVSYYVAIDRLSVAVAVVIQYTAPVLVIVLNAVRMQRSPSSSTVVAAVIALIGVVLVSGLGTRQFGLDGLGLLAAGSSAIFFASYTLLSEALVNQYGAIGVMFRGFVISSLFWLALQFAQGFPVAIFQASAVPGILFVGIGGTLIPFCLLVWGIQQVRAEQGAIAATLEPVMAAALAWLGLGQTLTPLQLGGGFLVIAAVTLLQVGWGDRRLNKVSRRRST